LEFPILALALVSMIVIGNHSLLTCALRGQENHLRYAWINAAPAVISAFGASLALFLGADLLVDTVVGVGLDVVVIACCWKPSGLRPIFPRVNLSFVRTAREFVYGGLPFVGWNLTMAFYGGIDRILLGFFVSSSELGWYGAAYRIIGIPIFIPNLVITPLFPALSRSQQEPDALRRVIAQVLRAVLVLMVPLSAAICVLAPEIPTLLGWPADFENSVPLMQILSIQVPIVGFDMVLGAVLMSLGLERRWMWVGLIAAVINVACNLVAIPFFQHTAQNGPIGAALVTVMTEVMMSIGAIALLPKQVFDKHILWSTTPRVVVAGIGAGLVAAWLMPVALILAAVAGAATYLALGLALRIISTDDMQIVRARLMRAHA
jgi:O-antigen/teichoic acid export membrane protein